MVLNGELRISIMNLILFLFLIITVLHANGTSKAEMFKMSETCKDEVCLKDESHFYQNSNYKETERKTQKTDNLLEGKEKNANLKKGTDIFNDKPSDYGKIEYLTVKNEVNKRNKSVEMFEHLSELLQEAENVTEEVNVDNALTEIPFIKMTEATTKNVVTTQKSPSINEFPNIYNKTNNNEACFCDMMINECDINCCCDKDCTSNHWKAFVKCIQNPIHSKLDYCFKHNFIYKNNKKMEVVENQAGLFCIIHDNLKTGLSFQRKDIIESLDSFNNIMPKTFYSFFNKKLPGYLFKGQHYYAGSFVWVLYNAEIQPFNIPVSTAGLFCSSEMSIKYLIDEVQICSYYSSQNKNGCDNFKKRNILQYLIDLRVISTPHSVNKSLNFDVEKICQNNVCIGIIINVCQEMTNCVTLTEKQLIPLKLGCESIISRIQYQIWHNGTEGIHRFEVFIWLRSPPEEFEGEYLQTVEVKFLWVTSNGTKKVLKKSGNPGYLTGAPLMSARKVLIDNGTSGRIEVMEISSSESVEWLNVLGSEMGICSLDKRIPINFRENGIYSCSLRLSKESFGKDNCTDLQKYIFKLLLAQDVANGTTNNYFKKFVAAFGNSKIEDTENWVPILIDFLPVITSQASFKFGHNMLVCRNIVTDLKIEIAYANVGSYMSPQSKILGVLFHFGKHKDFVFFCGSADCDKFNNPQYYKLSTSVHFIDLSEDPVDTFAEPLGLEIKLPHDFFYPFFSTSSITQSLDKFVSGLFFLTLLKIMW